MRWKFFLPLLISSPVFADVTYYVYGPEELEATWSALNAFVQLVGTSSYESALRVFFLLGLLLVAISILGSNRLKTVGTFVAGVFAVYAFLHMPRTTVNIHDMTCDGWRTPIDCDRSVANVPSLEAFLLQLMGTINKFTERVEVTYGSLKGGFPSMEKCTETLTGLTFNQLRDTQTREYFIHYVSECLVPCASLEGDIVWSTIADSENLLEDLDISKYPKCSLLEIKDEDTGTNVSCSSYYDSKIRSKLDTSPDLFLDPYWYDKIVTRYCSVNLNNNFGGKNDLSGEQIVRQAILLDGLLAALQQAGEGVEENLKARMLLTNQKLSSYGFMQAMSKWLSETIPVLKAVATIFFIAFTPIMLLFAVLPFAQRGVVVFFASALAIAFWNPALAIANAVINWFGEYKTSVLLYSPASWYEMKDKIWLAGAIGAVVYPLIPTVLGLVGALLPRFWGAVFSAGSPVHLPETLRQQASSPLGVKEAAKELVQRATFEDRNSLVSAGMFEGSFKAQENISWAGNYIKRGLSGSIAGAFEGTNQALRGFYGNPWSIQRFERAENWIRENAPSLAKSGFVPQITADGSVAVMDKDGNQVFTVDPVSGMVKLQKPDLGINALSTQELKQALSKVREQNYSQAFNLVWDKAYGHSLTKGIDKVSQNLEEYSHTQSGSKYRTFVEQVTKETGASESDVHKAVALLVASAGADGKLSLGEAQKALKTASQYGNKVLKVTADILNKLGFSVGTNLTGRGISEKDHQIAYTVSAKEGENYSVGITNNETFAELTKSVLASSERFGENFTKSEREALAKNLQAIDATKNITSLTATLGLSSSVDLSADFMRWLQDRYSGNFGEALKILQTAEGRQELLSEFIQDRLSERFKNIGEFTKALDNEFAKAWREFRKGNTNALKSIGLSNEQIENVKKLYERDPKEAQKLALSYRVENKLLRQNLSGLEPKKVTPEEVRKNIEQLTPSDNLREDVSNIISENESRAKESPKLTEAISQVPWKEVGLGTAGVALAEFLKNKAIDFVGRLATSKFAGNVGKALGLTALFPEARGEHLKELRALRDEVKKELFSADELKELTELSKKARSGDTEAAREYLKRWEEKLKTLEKANPERFNQIAQKVEQLTNLEAVEALANQVVTNGVVETKGLAKEVLKGTTVLENESKLGKFLKVGGKVLGAVGLTTTAIEFPERVTANDDIAFLFKNPNSDKATTWQAINAADWGFGITFFTGEGIYPDVTEKDINPYYAGYLLTAGDSPVARVLVENAPKEVIENSLNTYLSRLDTQKVAVIQTEDHKLLPIYIDKEGNVYDLTAMNKEGFKIEAPGKVPQGAIDTRIGYYQNGKLYLYHPNQIHGIEPEKVLPTIRETVNLSEFRELERQRIQRLEP